jgi:hypothetical protein
MPVNVILSSPFCSKLKVIVYIYCKKLAAKIRQMHLVLLQNSVGQFVAVTGVAVNWPERTARAVAGGSILAAFRGQVE